MSNESEETYKGFIIKYSKSYNVNGDHKWFASAKNSMGQVHNKSEFTKREVEDAIKGEINYWIEFSKMSEDEHRNEHQKWADADLRGEDD